MMTVPVHMENPFSHVIAQAVALQHAKRALML